MAKVVKLKESDIIKMVAEQAAKTPKQRKRVIKLTESQLKNVLKSIVDEQK